MEHFTYLDSFSVGPPSLGHLHIYMWQKALKMIYSIPNIPMFMDRKYIIPKWYKAILFEK